LPDEVKEAKWAYGVPLADIRRLVSRWKDGYDWRANECELNPLPMFTRTIEVGSFGELNLHYVHQRSAVEGAIPLLFVHGCTSVISHFYSHKLLNSYVRGVQGQEASSR
jgi:hypothetical protein